MYNVVYVYNASAGGYHGVRYYVSYQSAEESWSTDHSFDNKSTTVAFGVTDEEARNLTSLTPEVSRILAAVEDACYAEDGHFDPNSFEHHLQNSVFAINYDRKHIHEQGLTRIEFVKQPVDPAVTEKDRLINAVLNSRCVNNFGQVNLESMALELQFAIFGILSSRIAGSLRELGIDFGDEED